MKTLLSVVFAMLLVVSSFPVSGLAAVDQVELDTYLAQIQWTEDELDTYLWEYYGYRISDFESFEELEYFLGPVMTEESLQELLDAYELTREELDEIMALYGETVADYLFIDDIEFYIIEELNGYEEDYYYDDLFAEFGLTEEELDRLFTHLETLDFEAIEARLDAVYERLMAFEEFESATELSAEQIAELLSIMQEMLDIFEMDAIFTLVKSGEERSISLSELISMTNIEDYNLVISLFNKQGKFLADFILTNEMFGSELIQETAGDLPVVEKAVETKKEVKAQAQETVTGTAAITKTVKGEKLPYTGANYLANVLLGLSALVMGVWAVRRYRRQEA